MEDNGKRAKTLIKNTALYTISNFGSKIFSFLIVPLYTYYLSTSEYGTYDTIFSLVGLIGPICVLSIHEGILRWLLKSDEKIYTVIHSGFFVYLSAIGISDAIFMLLFQVYKWEYASVFILCLSTSTLLDVLQFATRGLKRNFAFAISGVIQTMVMLGFNILFVVVFKCTVRGMLYSLAMSQLISSVYLLISIWDAFGYNAFSFSKKLSKGMLVYSILLVPNNISWWVMNSSDRLMLTAMIGSTYTGIYSIACKFPSLLNMIHSIFYRAWQEQAVLEYDSDTRDEYYSKVFNVYMRLSCCAALVLIPVSKLYIRIFMSESFENAYKYIGVLMIGAIFSSFSVFYGTGYICAKDTKNATFSTIIGAFLNCLINLLFIERFGVWAACISTLVGYFVTWAIRVNQTKKYFNIVVRWNELAIFICLGIVFSILVVRKDNLSTIIMFAVAIIVSVYANHNIIKSTILYFARKIKK